MCCPNSACTYLFLRSHKIQVHLLSSTLTKDHQELVFLLLNFTSHTFQIAAWLGTSFNVSFDQKRIPSIIDVKFICIRDGKPLSITTTADNGGQILIRVDNMEVAGEVVQDMCTFLGITELESTATFPSEFETFRQVLSKVDEYNSIRTRLTADMADSSQLVKTMMIKAEDARILGNMKAMRDMYSNLYDQNRELIGEYIKRRTNHSELLTSLKDVNQMIQKAAKLRIGNAKTRIVTECRNAIKSNNIHSLFKIISLGKVS